MIYLLVGNSREIGRMRVEDCNESKYIPTKNSISLQKICRLDWRKDILAEDE
jgi:hypothetical protein